MISKTVFWIWLDSVLFAIVIIVPWFERNLGLVEGSVNSGFNRLIVFAPVLSAFLASAVIVLMGAGYLFSGEPEPSEVVGGGLVSEECV